MLPSMLMLGRCHYHCIRGMVSNWVARPLPRQGQLSSHADGFSTTTPPAPRLHPSCSTLCAVPAVTSEHSGEASIAQQHHPRVPLLPQGNPEGRFPAEAPRDVRWSLHCSAPRGERVSGKMRKSTNYTNLFRRWKQS